MNSTPILVGVGRHEADYADFPAPADIAASAARLACEDALGGALLAQVDTVAGLRLAADTIPPLMRTALAPFGTPDNFPRAVARRLGIDPAHAIYGTGDSTAPQHLIAELCRRIHGGESRLALLFGAEAGASERAARREQQPLDWGETVGGQLDDRRDPVLFPSRHLVESGITTPAALHALLEHAHRQRRGLDPAAYGDLLQRLLSRLDLTATAGGDTPIADPYRRWMMEGAPANHGAALLLTSVATARELGIPESRWIYLHGHGEAEDQDFNLRPDPGHSGAQQLAYRAALAQAGLVAEQVDLIDIRSSWPVAMLGACDALGITIDDPRGLSLTGAGLPGGQQVLHAIAEAVTRLRAEPAAYALIGASGNGLKRHAAAVYSARPCQWKGAAPRLPTDPGHPFSYEPRGWATIESHTVLFNKGQPQLGIVIGRLAASGERFLACGGEGDGETLERLLAGEPIGQRVYVHSHGQGNRFAFSPEQLHRLFPPKPLTLQSSYQYAIVKRRGPVLEVTLNRPEANNALFTEAHEELDQIFTAFEADPDLWLAIITGSGSRAFCTGNDLKVTASGKPAWVPKSGFGGLTARRDRTKPIIAAVNGFAMGGGFEIALACDLVVADRAARFALSEVRVGLFAGAGGIQRLARQIPRKLAVEMMLTARRVGAEEGRALGFVNQVAEEGKALEKARELAAALLEGSPTAVRLTLQLLRRSDVHAAEIHAVTGDYRDLLDELLSSRDALEGVMAFAEKRRPAWNNR